MAQPITVVDSFTDRPFTGNPAGVCVLTAPTTPAWMQAVAAELNLSDTAFVVSRHDSDGDDGEGGYDLRWFTPTVEVDLCGHATLASAHVLGGSGRFHTRSGLLVSRPGAEPGTIEMDFPANPPTPLWALARARARPAGRAPWGCPPQLCSGPGRQPTNGRWSNWPRRPTCVQPSPTRWRSSPSAASP